MPQCIGGTKWLQSSEEVNGQIDGYELLKEVLRLDSSPKQLTASFVLAVPG